MNTVNLCAWWHEPFQHKPDGLAVVRDVLSAMEAGLPVPERTARYLAQALQPCLDGDNDIAGRLHLRAPRRGGRHEAPVARAKKLARDQLVVAAVNAEKVWSFNRRCFMVYLLLRCDAVGAPRTCPFPLLDTVDALRQHLGPDIYLSHRQIIRIAKGETAYSQ